MPLCTCDSSSRDSTSSSQCSNETFSVSQAAVYLNLKPTHLRKLISRLVAASSSVRWLTMVIFLMMAALALQIPSAGSLTNSSSKGIVLLARKCQVLPHNREQTVWIQNFIWCALSQYFFLELIGKISAVVRLSIVLQLFHANCSRRVYPELVFCCLPVFCKMCYLRWTAVFTGTVQHLQIVAKGIV